MLSEGATYWFNCNPEHPYHWFYKEWIQKAAEKQVLYLHFQMTDNPSLSPAVLGGGTSDCTAAPFTAGS